MTQNWAWWAIGSAGFAGATAILAKIGVQGVDSNLATLLRTCVVLVFAGAIVLFEGGYKNVSQLSGRTLLFLALSGAATGASWLCYFRALSLGPASRVAPIDKLSVVFVIVFSTLFLREKLTWQLIAGAALIVAGALVLLLSPAPR